MKVIEKIITKKEVSYEKDISIVFKRGDKKLEISQSKDGSYYVYLEGVLSINGITKQSNSWKEIKKYTISKIEENMLEKCIK